MSFSDRTRSIIGQQAARATSRIARSQSYTPGASRVGTLSSAGPSVGRAARDLGGWSRGTKKAVGYIRRLRTEGSILVNADLISTTLSWLEAAAPPLVVGWERHLVPVFEHVVAQWPVASGASRDGIYMAAVPLGTDKVAMRVGGLADYTLLVRYRRSAEQRLGGFAARVVGAMRQRVERGNSLESAARWAASAFEVADNVENGQRQVLAWWRRQFEKREVYRLPDGTDAAGSPAWHGQAAEPWREQLAPMARTVEAALAALVARRAA